MMRKKKTTLQEWQYKEGFCLRETIRETHKDRLEFVLLYEPRYDEYHLYIKRGFFTRGETDDIYNEERMFVKEFKNHKKAEEQMYFLCGCLQQRLNQVGMQKRIKAVEVLAMIKEIEVKE